MMKLLIRTNKKHNENTSDVTHLQLKESNCNSTLYNVIQLDPQKLGSTFVFYNSNPDINLEKVIKTNDKLKMDLSLNSILISTNEDNLSKFFNSLRQRSPVSDSECINQSLLKSRQEDISYLEEFKKRKFSNLFFRFLLIQKTA
jgi:hypothetical protein